MNVDRHDKINQLTKMTARAEELHEQLQSVLNANKVLKIAVKESEVILIETRKNAATMEETLERIIESLKAKEAELKQEIMMAKGHIISLE